MTKTARLYGGSLYDLAAEEQLTGIIMEQMMEIRQLFRDNPDYVKLLGEPSIPQAERIDLIEKAFGAQAERYLVNFIKVLCERSLLGDFGGCCEEFTRRYNADNGIAEAVVTSAVALTECTIGSALKMPSIPAIICLKENAAAISRSWSEIIIFTTGYTFASSAPPKP